MKFLYGYKTKDNEMREGTIDAPSRNDVYKELKKQGIKPFKVELAPGFGNWLCSLGKRTYAIIALGILCIALAVTVGRVVLNAPQSDRSPQPRHQIYGDPALMGELERTDYATVFAHPGDRVLARYAQPGQIVKREEGSGGKRDDVVRAADALADLMKNPPELFSESDTSQSSREVIELKRIVLGMRQELRRYLSVGTGTPERYCRRLNQRQEREAAMYFQAKNDLKNPDNFSRWESINASLRNVGLKTIPMPDGPVPGKGKGTLPDGNANPKIPH